MSVSARKPESPAAVDVILRDGSTLRLEEPSSDDLDALEAFFTGLSDRSFYQRFHGVRTVDRALVEHFADPDWRDRGVLVGVLADEIVAVAEFMRLRDERSAEVAFAVADEHQRRGIGTRLLEQLAMRGSAAGIERFVAEVLPENSAMLAVFRDAGFDTARELDQGAIEVAFPIAATETFRARVDERDHRAVTASLRPFFEPRSLAVVGASHRRGSIGGELFRNVLAADFEGAAYPVNRDGEPVGGVRGFQSLADLPEAVDLVVICLPGQHVLGVAEEALANGIKALCVISSGFAEIGAEGAERQARLLELVRAHGGRLVGPNCLGIAIPPLGLNATFGPRPLPPGPIAFSSQSGALGLALLEKASERRLGFSAFVSIGNKADVSSNDLLEWWEDDPASEVVLLYLESFGNPGKFSRLARRVARRKPILALKAGTTGAGAKAASSHTAALASSDAAVDALFHQAGVLRARTLEELVDAAALLSRQPLPGGSRVGVLTNAGGLGILCADACESAGLELPEPTEETRAALAEVLPAEASVANPVDMLGGSTAATYAKVIPPLLADRRLDALIVLFVPPVVAGAEEVAVAIRDAVTASGSNKPVLAVVMSAEGTPSVLLEDDCPVVSFEYPESAARALGLAASRSEWLRQPAGTVPQLEAVDRAGGRRIVEEALASGEGWLEPDGIRALLEAYGVPLVPERDAASARRGGDRCGRARLPGRRQDCRGRRAQDRERRGRARSQGRGAAARGRRADRRAGARPALHKRRRGAARGRRPGSGLRAARRLRPRWRARGADRRRELPARATHGRRREGARARRKGRAARSRLPRRPGRRCGGARRSRPPTLGARGGSPRGRRARPEPRDRAPRPLRGRRRPHPGGRSGAEALPQDLVSRRRRDIKIL